MTIIFVPTEACNFKCSYCFEPESQRAEASMRFNLDAMKQGLIEVWSGPYRGSDICLHGGEFTICRREDIKEMMEFIYGFKGVVDIVTNGSLIDDELIEMFKKYNVHIGLSCDGPPDLNVLRGPNPSDKKVTKKYNVELNETLVQLRKENLPVSIMCILHTKNAGTQKKIDKLRAWMRWLANIGINGGRFNLMYGNPKYELSLRQATHAWLELYEENKRLELDWNPFKEMTGNLMGEKVSPCSFSQCNIFNTKTLSILPDGSVGNCDRTFSEGIYLRSYDDTKSGRYEALHQNQCLNCKYWDICGGACPMEGQGNDWRNPTRFCDAIYDLYSRIERDLRREGKMIITDVGLPILDDKPHGDSGHGDKPHGDSGHGDSGHGDMPHGDKPHGDSSHPDAPDWKLNKETLEWEQ